MLALAVDRLLADDALGRGARGLVVVCAWVSLGLWMTIVWPGVVNQDNLDAKPSNALAAIGVGFALALTLWAIARRGVGRCPRGVVGDRAAIVLIALLLVARIRPGLTPAWGGLLVCAALAYRLVMRPCLREVAAA